MVDHRPIFFTPQKINLRAEAKITHDIPSEVRHPSSHIESAIRICYIIGNRSFATKDIG
jgi:hypothetical protein